jgi:hypothetical protein
MNGDIEKEDSGGLECTNQTTSRVCLLILMIYYTLEMSMDEIAEKKVEVEEGSSWRPRVVRP